MTVRPFGAEGEDPDLTVDDELDEKIRRVNTAVANVRTAQTQAWAQRREPAQYPMNLATAFGTIPTALGADPQTSTLTPSTQPSVGRISAGEQAGYGLLGAQPLADPTTTSDGVRKRVVELDDIRTAVNLTLGYEAEPGHNDLVARRVHAFLEDNPDMWNVYNDDLERLITASDPETYELIPGLTTAQIIKGTSDMLDEVIVRDRTAARVQLSEKAEAERFETVNGTEITGERRQQVEARIRDTFGLEPEAEARMWTGTDFHQRPAGPPPGTSGLVAAGRTFDAAFYPSSGRLIGEVYDQDVPDPVGMIDIRLDPGTDIESTDDLLFEVAVARLGLAHEIVTDEIPDPQTAVGQLFEWVDGAGDWLDRQKAPGDALRDLRRTAVKNGYDGAMNTYVPDWRTAAEQYQAENQEWIRQQVQVVADTASSKDEIVLAAGAQLLAGGIDSEVDAAFAANEWWDSLGTEGQQAFQDDVRADMLDSEDLVKFFHDRMDDRNGLKRGIDQVLNTVGTAFSWYDSFVQQTGTVVVAELEAAAGIVGVPGADRYQEGLGSFTAAWDEAWEKSNVPDYFGLTGGTAALAHMASSTLFDPFVWVTPGGKGLAQEATRRLTTRQGAEEIMRLPSTKARVYELAIAIEKGDANVIHALTNHMSPEIRASLMSGEMSGRALEAATEAYRRSIPANGGVNVLDTTSHHARNTAQAVALDAARYDKLPAKMRQFFVDRLGQHSRERIVSLGPRAIDDIGDFLTVMYRNNSTEAAEAYRELYRLTGEQVRPVTAAARTLAARRSQLADELNELVTNTPMPVQRFTDRVENARRRLTAAEAAGDEARVQLERDALASIEESRSAHKAFTKARRKTLNKLHATEKVNVAAGAKLGNTESLQRFVAEQVEKWGDRLDLPRLAKENPVTGRPMHDWSLVNGGSTWDPTFSDVKGVSPSAVVAEPGSDLSKALQATGFGKVQSNMQLPASPYQIVAYEAAQDRSKMTQLLARAAAAAKVQDFTHFTNFVFSTAVLSSPSTIVRSNVEEPLRYIQEGLTSGGSRNRAIGIASTYGDEPLRGNITPGAAIPFRQFAKLEKRLADRAAGYARENLSPLSKIDARGYQEVAHGKKGWMSAAQHWTNGIALNEPVTRQVWSLLDDPDGFARFVEWLDTDGYQFKKAVVIGKGKGVKAIDARKAWDSRAEVLDGLLSTAKESSRGSLRAAFVRAARDGGGLRPQELRQLRMPFPGFVDTSRGAAGFVDRALFQPFYSGPAGRRATMGYEHVFANTLEPLWKAAEDRGELLTVSRFSEIAGVDVETAAQWLRDASSAQVEILMDYYGLKTPQMLADVADRVARQKMNNTMYQMAASSYLGRGLQGVYPYGRPTFDFLTYQKGALTQAMTLGLNPTARDVLSKIPGVRRAVQPDVPFLGRSVQVGVGRHVVPLNLRLAARFGEIAGWAQSEVEDYFNEHPEAADLRRFEPSGALDWLEALTFIPFRADQLVLDLGPGLGPIPSYLLHMLPADVEVDTSPLGKIGAAVRSYAEALHPALEFDERQFSPLSWEGLGAATDYLIPNTKGTVRHAGTDLLRWFNSWLASDAESANASYLQLVASLDRWGRPATYYKELKANMGTMFAENGGPFTPGSDVWEQARATAVEDTVASTVTLGPVVDAWLTRGRLGLDSYDGEHIPQYQGLIDNLDQYRDVGIVGDSQVADIRELWTLATDPATEGKHAEAFVDRAKALLFDLPRERQEALLVEHPELVVNLISAYTCGTVGGEPVNPDICGRGGRLNLPPGEDGRNLFREGLDKGWIVERPEAEMFAEANQRLARAVSSRSRALWTAVTGEEWFGGPTDVNGAPNLPGRVQGQRFTLSETQQARAAALGLELGDKIRFSAEELSLAIDRRLDQVKSNTGLFDPLRDRGIGNMKTVAMADVGNGESPNTSNIEYVDGLDLLLRRVDDMMDTLNFASFDDLPAGAQSELRDYFGTAINRGLLSEAEYGRFFESSYGELDYAAPQPPPADGLEFSFTVDPDEWEVVDGDTVRVYLADGPHRIRLLGVNAADYNSRDEAVNTAAIEQADRLETILRNADTVQFGIWEPEQFGTFQEVDPTTGEIRFLLWLYVDGEAVFNPDVFTSRNPVGVSSTGTGVPELVSDGAV